MKCEVRLDGKELPECTRVLIPVVLCGVFYFSMVYRARVAQVVRYHELALLELVSILKCASTSQQIVVNQNTQKINTFDRDDRMSTSISSPHRLPYQQTTYDKDNPAPEFKWHK